MMISSYGYVYVAFIFHVHLTSHDYNLGMSVSVAILNKPLHFYISESLPVINGLNKYM